MNHDTSDAIKLVVINKIQELSQKIKELGLFAFGDADLYVKTSWLDYIYPGTPSDDYISKTIEEGIDWLSKQSHPMGFSGCRFHMGLYIDILDEPTLIKSYEAEKLARLKRAEMDYSYENI